MKLPKPRFCQTYKGLDKGEGLDNVEYSNSIILVLMASDNFDYLLVVILIPFMDILFVLCSV